MAIVLWVGQEGVDTDWILEMESLASDRRSGVKEFVYGRPTILLPQEASE